MRTTNKVNTKYLTILIIAIIILIGSFYYISLKTLPDKTPNINYNSDFIPAIPQEEKYTLEEVYELNDPNKCNQLKDKSLINTCIAKLGECENDNCFYIKATSSHQAYECKNIQNEDLQTKCYVSIQTNDILERAYIQDDISICNEFEFKETIDSCHDFYYHTKALNSKDISHCENIKNEEVKNDCIKIN